MSISVIPGVIVERVGDDLMVIVPGNSDVVSLSGRTAEVFLAMKAGRKVDSADSALSDLVDLGIVSAPGLSRRGLIKAGAIGAGAGIAVLAMPGVAAASSTEGEGGPRQLVLNEIFGPYGADYLREFYVRIAPYDFEANPGLQELTSTVVEDNGTTLIDVLTNTGFSLTGIPDAFVFVHRTTVATAPRTVTVSFDYLGVTYTALFTAS